MAAMTNNHDRELALALAGGNALGAFQAGALSALHRRGRRPSLIAGVSIGSVNAVLYAAPRNGDPEATLRMFWHEIAQDLFTATRGQQEILAALSALLYGRPTLSRGFLTSFPSLFTGRNALQDPAPLAATLARLVDFDALSRGSIRCILGATALEPDEPHAFDSSRDVLRPEHVLASAALPVLMPPVKIGDRTYVDGGVSINLPLPWLSETAGPPLDCLSMDLFSLGGRVPRSLDAAVERLQNQMFAFQSEQILRGVAASKRPMRVIHTSYRPAERESSAKTLDFSRRSVEKRWAAGEEAMARILERLATSAPPGNSLERV